MAERVKEFPRKPRGNQKWGFLTDGSVWKLGPDDMEGYKSDKSLMAAIRYFAREAGMRCQIMEHEGFMYVQLIPKKPKPRTEDELRAMRTAKRQARVMG